MSEAGILDFSGLDATASAVESTTSEVTETPAVETSVEGSETTETAKTSEVKTEKTQYDSSGQPIEKEAAAKAEDLPGTEKTPQEIRKALKAFRDADPVANGNAVKQLHGAYERWEAAKAIYPGGVKEMQQAKEFADLVGGAEGYEKLTSTVQAAETSDTQLYSGDPQLIQNIVEDLKSNGKLDALGKLAPSFLDAVKANDEKGYYAAFAPHFFEGLETANLPGAINGLAKALSDPDPAKALAAAKEISGDLSNWYKDLGDKNKKSKESIVSPERKALDAERAAFMKEQETFKTNQSEEFKNSVAKSCESVNNKSLGAELGTFLKMPFFKGFGRENLIPLGNTIKSNLYATLKADSAYQAQMKSMWAAKTPDRAKIEEYHKARVQSISAEIVRDTVQRMYPGYAKGGAAAGRVAAATEKKVAQTKVEDTAAASGKPIYVATKPKWEAIDWDKDPKQLLYITGKAFLKGKGTLVTWRK
jgi:hypothetical protein